jgi:hypothetical protein
MSLRERSRPRPLPATTFTLRPERYAPLPSRKNQPIFVPPTVIALILIVGHPTPTGTL